MKNKQCTILVFVVGLLASMPITGVAQTDRPVTTDQTAAGTGDTSAARPAENTAGEFSKASAIASASTANGQETDKPANPSRHQPASTANHSSEAEVIESILSGRPYGMTTFTMSADFCTAFFKDFREQKGITYIDPIIVTDDYDDPALASYKAKCGSKLHMNQQVACVPRLADLPPERRRYACNVYYGTGKFRMYHVDMDNDPSNGKEYVFYYRAECGPQDVDSGNPHCAPDMTYDNGNYKVLDLNQCKVMGSATAGSSLYDYEDYEKDPLNNHSGIIEYRSDYYIYNLSELTGSKNPASDSEYRLVLSHYGKSKYGDAKILGACSYSTTIMSYQTVIEGNDS